MRSISYSIFCRRYKSVKIVADPLYQTEEGKPLKILGYCVMPDHYHVLLKINSENYVSHYINTVENSYTRFFNTKIERKGPLWQNRFRSIRIKSEEQLLHVSRYIHLNPVVAGLVSRPIEWVHSSYKYYLDSDYFNKYLTEISIRTSQKYEEFVNKNIKYGKRQKVIKRAFLE